MADNIFKTVSTKSDVNDPLLQYVFVEELKDFYWTERLFMKLLIKMHKAAQSSVLKQAFKLYLTEIIKQNKKLISIFHYLENMPKFQFFEQMCLFSEGESLVSNILHNKENKDYSLIMLAQKLCQFEQKSFADIITFAKILGYQKLSRDLQDYQDKRIMHYKPLDISVLCNQKEKKLIIRINTFIKPILRLFCF